MKKKILMTASILGALAVVTGAFGAHGLRETLLENGKLETFETAVEYHFYHVFALLIAGVLAEKTNGKFLYYSAICFTIGILIFSGSLYLLSVTNQTVLGAIAPIGGVLFIAGWLLLFWGIKKMQVPG